MNKINPLVLANLRSSLMGRLKLALFREILGKHDMAPTVKEVQRYIRSFTKQQITFVEIAVYVLNDARFILVDHQQMAQDIDVGELFARLDRFPLRKPIFLEVVNFLPDKPIGVMVHWHQLAGNIGHFYAITFMDEHYPSQVSYFEIRVSQSEPEPAYCYYDQDGQWVSSAKADPGISKNEPLWLCVEVLKFLSDHYTESFLTLEQSLEKSKKAKFKKKDSAPDDPVYTKLVQQVFLGQILCHVAEVDFDMIRPFSFDACFMIPYFEIQQAKRNIDDHVKSGLVVYWKDGAFVTSDDYLTYMVLRVAGISKVKIVVLGDQGLDNAKVLLSGGADLLPGVHIFASPGVDRMDEASRMMYLDEYVARLSAVMNLKDLIKSRCVVFSEDSKTGMLEVLVQSNGFDTEQTTIMSYSNCTKIDLLPLTLETLRKVNKDLIFIVHRDKDYLSAEKLEDQCKKITALGAIPFVTKGTDIESHFLDPEHISAIIPTISLESAVGLVEVAREKTRELSIEKMLKEKYGKKHEMHAAEKPELAKIYESDPERYTCGKETMNILRSMLHSIVKGNKNLYEPSAHLEFAQLKEIASRIWNY